MMCGVIRIQEITPILCLFVNPNSLPSNRQINKKRDSDFRHRDLVTGKSAITAVSPSLTRI